MNATEHRNQKRPKTAINSSRCYSSGRLKFSQGVRRLLEHSTVHGFSHLATAGSKLGRSTWFVLCMAGFAGFLVNLSFMIERYMTRPVLTSYVSDYEGFIWPDITVCSPMAPYAVHLENRKTKWEQLRSMALNASKYISPDLFTTIDPADANETAVQALVYSTLTPTDFGVANAQDLVHFVAIDTGYRGIVLTVELDGNLSRLEEPMSQYFHSQILQKRYNIPCYTFQLARSLSSELHRKTGKIAMGLKFNFESYVIVNSSYTYPAIDLFISLPGQVPEGDLIELLPGYAHSLGLKMARIRREPARQPCHRNSFTTEIFDADLHTKRRVHASASFCHRLMSQRLYVNICNCYSPFLPYPVMNDHPVFSISPKLCFNMSLFDPLQLNKNTECMFRVYQHYRNSSVYMSLPEAQFCEQFATDKECEKIVHHVSGLRRTAMVELWSNSYNEARASFLAGCFDNVFGEEWNLAHASKDSIESISVEKKLNFLRNNLALLTITRKDPLGELIREELEYPLPELFSDVGGLMGLWIGLSVIGLFEIVEFWGYFFATTVNWLGKHCSSARAKMASPNPNKKNNTTHNQCGDKITVKMAPNHGIKSEEAAENIVLTSTTLDGTV